MFTKSAALELGLGNVTGENANAFACKENGVDAGTTVQLKNVLARFEGPLKVVPYRLTTGEAGGMMTAIEAKAPVRRIAVRAICGIVLMSLTVPWWEPTISLSPSR